MKKKEFKKLKISIDNNYLYFNDVKIELENIESVNCQNTSIVKLTFGIKTWFKGFIILLALFIISLGTAHIQKNLEIYIYLLLALLIFNLIKFLLTKNNIIIITKSGQKYIKKYWKKSYIKEIKNTIETQKERKIKKNKNHTIINNNIISTGNNTQNNIINQTIKNKTEINHKKIEQELKELLNYTQEKEIVKEAIKASKTKDDNKLRNCLSKLGKATIKLIKELGLIVLEKYIEKNILK